MSKVIAKVWTGFYPASRTNIRRSPLSAKFAPISRKFSL